MAYPPPHHHHPFSPNTSYPPPTASRRSYPYPLNQQQHQHHQQPYRPQARALPPPAAPISKTPRRYGSQPVLPYVPVSHQRSTRLSVPEISNQFKGMSLEQAGPPLARSQLLSAFENGNTIVLQAVSSRAYLSIRAGEVETSLEQNGCSQFIVHVKQPGVVALQNVGNDSYLAIYEGRINGGGRGGPYCDFCVVEIDEKTIGLESIKYPSQRIGITPGGVIKAPVENDMGDDIRFVPVVISYGTRSLPQPSPPIEHTSIPPQSPEQSLYPAEPPPYPGVPPQLGYMAQSSVSYPVLPPVNYGPPAPVPVPVSAPHASYIPPPQGPQVPYGYIVMDAFQPGNVVQLISKVTNAPLTVIKGKLSASGTFGKDNSTFTVVTATASLPGTVMLRNCVATGLYLAVGKSGHSILGKGQKESHLRVIVHSDRSVSLQSVLSGNCLSFGQKGQAVKSLGVQDAGAQFRIRLEKQVNTNSQILMSPFGRPSIANQIRAGCVIQLYMKGYNNHLGITKAGNIITVSNGGDTDTFFRVIDRGMGVISLDSYKHCEIHLYGCRLVMKDRSLCGKGPPNLHSDFLLKENADGTVCLESVTYAGSFIGIDGGGQLHANLGVYLVSFENIRGSDTITRTPLN